MDMKTMNWRKIGLVFNPIDHIKKNNSIGYAQSPQTLIFEDYIRIYFSTRIGDPVNKKHLSTVSFVDLNKSLTKILRVCDHTVIELGQLGCYDEHGIFPFNVLRHDNKIWGYIGGWNRKASVSVDTSIGVALSRDNGETFQRIGTGPVLTASLQEPFLVGDPFVAVFNEYFFMWYIFGTEWRTYKAGNLPERIYKIGYAVSKDGINWKKPQEGKQLIESRLGPDESQALPTVIFSNGIYHMLFCYRESYDFRTNKNRSYRIGYAYSEDLINWTRNDDLAGIDVSNQGWDSEMLCYPHLFHCDGKTYLLYNGNEFGRLGFGLAVLEA